jgi:N-formylglutamate amidohydrolase
MFEFGPPIAPDPGCERSHVCLSDAEGTCPNQWFKQCVACFKRIFGEKVSVNTPFKGGYTIRTHCRELPWIQVELSRGAFLTDEQKRERVSQALTAFCHSVF